MHILVPMAPFFIIQRERNLNMCSPEPCSKFHKKIPRIDDGLAHTVTIYGVSYQYHIIALVVKITQFYAYSFMHILVSMDPFFIIQRERNLDVCSPELCSKFQKKIPRIDDGQMICVLRGFGKFWIADYRKISPTLSAKYPLITGLILRGRRFQ